MDEPGATSQGVGSLRMQPRLPWGLYRDNGLNEQLSLWELPHLNVYKNKEKEQRFLLVRCSTYIYMWLDLTYLIRFCLRLDLLRINHMWKVDGWLPWAAHCKYGSIKAASSYLDLPSRNLEIRNGHHLQARFSASTIAWWLALTTPCSCHDPLIIDSFTLGRKALKVHEVWKQLHATGEAFWRLLSLMVEMNVGLGWYLYW